MVHRSMRGKFHWKYGTLMPALARVQGVKIYSYRVDSVHSEVYKVLGGLSRTEKPRADGEADEHGGTCRVGPAWAWHAVAYASLCDHKEQLGSHCTSARAEKQEGVSMRSASRLAA